MRAGVPPGCFPVKFSTSAVDLTEAGTIAIVLDITAASATFTAEAGASAAGLAEVPDEELILADGTPLSDVTLEQGKTYLASYIGPYAFLKLTVTGGAAYGVALEPRNPERQAIA